MCYPLKFKPVYKDYIWGGRNFEKLGKILPEGIVAESWEVSCHPDGISIISNGKFKGLSLPRVVEISGRRLIGTKLSEKDISRFPLLVKFIDANNDLSVQVHPDDNYAMVHENGEYGKNEMWYIISAEPGASLIYDVVPGTTKDHFASAIIENQLEKCLKKIHVSAGDVINIPAGLVHAVGKGIMLAEIQQNSNTTYRVYDYNRTDINGIKRPLHIEKALDVIDFESRERAEKYKGLSIEMGHGWIKRYLVANRYFSVELYDVNGEAKENACGDRFFIYTFISGKGVITFQDGIIDIKGGESVLIPASMGEYRIEGVFKALKSYVPDILENVIKPLEEHGYSKNSIYKNVGALI